jgi:hypothetical protein
MTGSASDLDAARRRAVERRVAGVVVDFDPARLALAGASPACSEPGWRAGSG